MKKTTLCAMALAAGMASGMAVPPAALAEESAFAEFKILTLETAQTLAQAALDDCRARGYQVAVVVVDRFGQTQVALRDRFAGPHTISTATRKAWTSVSFRTSTLELSELTASGEMAAIRDLDMALALGGGVPVEAGEGGIVGGVGVSGAPAPSEDDACSRAGIAAIEDAIAF